MYFSQAPIFQLNLEYCHVVKLTGSLCNNDGVSGKNITKKCEQLYLWNVIVIIPTRPLGPRTILELNSVSTSRDSTILHRSHVETAKQWAKSVVHGPSCCFARSTSFSSICARRKCWYYCIIFQSRRNTQSTLTAVWILMDISPLRATLLCFPVLRSATRIPGNFLILIFPH